ETRLHAPAPGIFEAQHEAGFMVQPRTEPSGIGFDPDLFGRGNAKRDIHQLEGDIGRAAFEIEQGNRREALIGAVPALAAPAAQRPAVAGEPPAAGFLELEAETVGSRIAIAESLRTTQATIDSVFVVACRVDKLFPGDHVVERRADARIAHPVDAIDG